MPYSNGAAVYRGDLAGHVFETADWEKGLIGSMVAPIVNVDVAEGQYPKFLKKEGQLLKRGVKARAPLGSFPRDTMSYVYDTYTCQEWGIEMPVDEVLSKKMSRFFDAELVAASQARRKLLLDYEIRVAAQTFSTSNYDSNNSATAYTVANLATFDVGLDVDTAKDLLISRGEGANTAVIPYQVWTRIKASTKFQNRARGLGFSSDAILNITPEAASEIFELDNVYVPRCAYDGAGENVAYSSTLIWSNTYIWVGKVTPVSNPAGMLMGGAQYTLNWSAFGPPVGIFTYRDEPIKADIVRAEQNTAEKVVNTSAGTLIATQYS